MKGLHHAITGITIALKEEFHFKIEIFVGFVTIILGWYLRLATDEWVLIILSCGLVLTTEIINTAFEELCDKFHPDHDPHIAKIKDLAAAAVLLSAVTASSIGFIIFLPYFCDILWT